jgi:hypothetical protein
LEETGMGYGYKLLCSLLVFLLWGLLGLMVLLSLSKKPFVLCIDHSVEMAE